LPIMGSRRFRHVMDGLRRVVWASTTIKQPRDVRIFTMPI
jgi:hypothetical protein